MQQIRAERENTLDDRRCDVVRQIARHLHRPPFAQVGFQNIAVLDGEFGFVSEFLLKVMNQHLVEFNRVDARRKFNQVLSEGSLPGADFDDGLIREGTSGGGDSFKNRTICKEMLTEPASGHSSRVSPLLRCGCSGRRSVPSPSRADRSFVRE